MEHLDDTDRSFLDDLLPWSKTRSDICQSTKIIKESAARNDGFYSKWYSWFTAHSKSTYKVFLLSFSNLKQSPKPHSYIVIRFLLHKRQDNVLQFYSFPYRNYTHNSILKEYFFPLINHLETYV